MIKHKTNCISCLFTTETSEPAASVGRTSRAKAALCGYMSTERLMITWSSVIGIANFQIGAIFINKPQIWILNYILAWKTLKTTFHDTTTVIFWKLGRFLAMTFHKSTRMHIEKRLLSVWKYKIHRYIFLFAHTDVNKSNTHGQQSGTSEGEALSPCITQKWRF